MSQVVEPAQLVPLGLDETPETVWVVRVRGNAYLCVVPYGQRLELCA